MGERRDVIVVGGGVIGICTAWSLAQRGACVRVIERHEIGSGCSSGNAGWILPSRSQPLPVPGVIGRSLRAILRGESAVSVHPRPNLDLARWLARFVRASRTETARRSTALRRELILASLELFTKLAARPGLDFGLNRSGLLLVFRTRAGLEEALREIPLLEALGGQAERLDGGATRERVPALIEDVVGGILLPDDASLNPGEFLRGLAAEAAGAGVEICTGTELLEIRPTSGGVRLLTTRGSVRAEQVVIAAGAWSPTLVASAGIRLPIEAAKGYSLSIPRPHGFGTLPVMLSEAHIAVTPLESELRFAGRLDLSGVDLRVNVRHVRALERAARAWLPALPPSGSPRIWRGLRPLAPDDLPVIGRSRRVPALVIATGHGQKGVAQGPITGELVAELVCGEPPSLDLEPFSPDRFTGGDR